MTAAWDTVVTREATWLGTDPQWTGGPPNLLASSNPAGPLDLVSAYVRSPLQEFRALYVTRTRSVTDALAEAGNQLGGGYGAKYLWRHEITLLLTWTFETGTGDLTVESQALETALANIEWRIRGPVGDKTHGNAFLAAAIGDQRDVITVTVGDGRPDALQVAKEAGSMLRCTITYPVYDEIIS